MIEVLNLGAGIQSTAIFLMSCRGDLPKFDYAIFADTGWEPVGVYDNVEWLKGKAARAGIELVVVQAGNIKSDIEVSQVRGTSENGRRWASMPLHVANPDGSRGMVRRQCTREYKLDPIRAFIRTEILGLRKGQHAPREHTINQWFGISSDEAQRARVSPDLWSAFVYPLLGIPHEYLNRTWSRAMCLDWLAEHYPDRRFVRSACIGCPFRSNAEWRALTSAEFSEAVEVDETIRHAGGMRGDVYLHRSTMPLNRVDLGRDQGELWGNECEGMCGT